ncbi:MAG TPA: aminotransferase class IV [Fibrobacteria bacterium]|nr:aminotransferase class IV [Fibrobacteria bacterium]
MPAAERKASRPAKAADAPKAPKTLYAYVNGRIVPADKAVVSVFDRGLVLGDGLFETVRAWDGHPQFFGLHYQRLSKSAKRLRIRLEMDEAGLENLVKRLCARSGLADAVVRITLTRGHYLGGLAIDPSLPPTLIITVAPVSGLPPELYERGVKVAISTINKAAASGLDSAIKSTNYLANIFAKAEADRKGAYEAILLGPHGEIAELSTSSFFCVVKGKVLTPPLETGILPGITRQVLLRILRRKRIPFGEVALFPKETGMMEEAFLCSSVRGPLPITRIEGGKIGGGKVGPVFRLLRELYDRECQADASSASDDSSASDASSASGRKAKPGNRPRPG